MYQTFLVRNAHADEFERIGNLLVDVYAALEGFPGIDEQPEYYNLLRHVGKLTENEHIQIFVAVNQQQDIGGVVVFFNDMKYYGSGGTATLENNACGFRLLAVDAEYRGLGLGKLLTQYCINQARVLQKENLVIHTTNAMKLAWRMYERLGFKRASDLDFMQGNLEVFGFRLFLNTKK